MAERWLTYQQAGELLGMTAEAARHRARRMKWRTQPGNEGRALVLVPDDAEAAKPPVRPPVRTAVQTPVRTAMQASNDNVLAGLLREQLERAAGEVAAVRAELDKALACAAQAEAEREAARIAVAAAEGELKGLQATMAETREALAEARRPFWRRWIG